MTTSVIIPVFNGERYLREAIDSVLRQSVPATEIIAVDDGSTDSSPEILASYHQVTCVRQENAGTAAARNRGVRQSRGDLLAFLDQDDLWESTKLEVQQAALRQHPEMGVAFGYVRQFFSPEVEATLRNRFEIPDSQQEGYSPSAMLVRRTVFDHIGPFNEDLSQAEWIDWLLRLKDAKIPVLMLNEVVCHRRVHETNKGVVSRERRVEYLRALKASLGRRT